MKLYTKTGDDGTTGLFGGQRVPKDSLRIEATGAVDELNSHIGLARACCRHDELARILIQVQARLFEAGADLSTPVAGGRAAAQAQTLRIEQAHIAEIEGMIDLVCAPVPPMKYFVLPGGTPLAAYLHVARASARRAERVCLGLARVEQVGAPLLIYLNRLSDLLFAMARRANQLDSVEDVPWLGQDGKP